MKNSKTSRILTGSSSQSWVNGAGLDSNGLRPVLPPRTLRLFVWCINIGCNWQGAGIHYRWEHTTRRNYLHTQVTQSIYLNSRNFFSPKLNQLSKYLQWHFQFMSMLFWNNYFLCTVYSLYLFIMFWLESYQLK